MTDNLGMVIVAAVAAALVGWWLGRSMGRGALTSAIGSYARQLASGGPEPAPADLAEVDRALRAHWVPAGSELSEAASRALERITAYLQDHVEEPLQRAVAGPPALLQDSVEGVLGALQDIEFFAVLPDAPLETIDLRTVVDEVASEYSDDAGVAVHVSGPERLMVRGNAERVKDALFLILHNAGQFGEGSDVDIVLSKKDGSGRVVVADRGPGFTAEALSRAYDPFYSTSSSGLGLGLTHARRLVEAMGGGTHLRNREGGGAEVEVGLSHT